MRYFVLSGGFLLFVMDRLVKDFFTTRSIVCNTGIAFGIALPVIFLCISIAIALTALLIVCIKAYKSSDTVLFAALFFIFIGALSNGIDRLIYGCVVDYLFISRSFVWFNGADIGIFCGGVVLLWWYRKRS